ncbi:N-acyl homoserine lactonase family protein [Lacticaseibacillus kribbianus]|uniref:N-acyl homoserine lactonase family protein n=1 Tax=Lacticaseibacillus kribbianus TaxID=2926292 RepID=UPI001CD4EA01|nr:N-acyl homoserine lactonase family protein [Lacticaseibacillus kribbianus]
MTDTIKIHVLHTGLVKVDKALPFHGLYRNPLAFTGLVRSEANQVTLPVSSYLIEHPKGLVLIDTGWNKLVRTSNWRELGPQVQINTAYLPAGWAIDERLAALGYRPQDLDYVLLSHLHCDHVSGLKHVAAAKHILVSEPEWRVANRLPLVYLPHEWRGVNVQTYRYAQARVGPTGEAYDVFGDDRVLQVHTAGHATGMSATLARGGDGRYVLLAADVGYANRSWEEMLTPGICTNRKAAITSLGWVREMAHDPNCIEALANHNTTTDPHVITLTY